MIFVVAILYGIYLVLINAWALSLLWGWYISPLGFPTITFVEALGLMLVVGLFQTPPSTGEKSLAGVIGALIGLAIKPILAVILGKLLLHFV